MCKEEKNANVNITAVKPNNKTKKAAEKLYKDLKLEDNEILRANSKLKKDVYKLIDEFQDVFTDENCKVGKTSWETFNIELYPDSKPVRQRIRPLPPPPSQNN